VGALSETSLGVRQSFCGHIQRDGSRVASVEEIVDEDGGARADVEDAR
jgi:hypothetical protein